uniref:Uncharacterized protein n=1 Tax=Oryza sativa subsp. japonica TaxID=39947 RepID=Q109A6_ORYSJ|nr:hypothetical protein LOC_Os10g39932 [Oryza sativa Japonica Group]
MARGSRGGEGASRARWHEGMCAAEDTERTKEEVEERENAATLAATEPPALAANFSSLREAAAGTAGGKSKRKKGAVSRRTWSGRGTCRRRRSSSRCSASWPGRRWSAQGQSAAARWGVRAIAPFPLRPPPTSPSTPRPLPTSLPSTQSGDEERWLGACSHLPRRIPSHVARGPPPTAATTPAPTR